MQHAVAVCEDRSNLLHSCPQVIVAFPGARELRGLYLDAVLGPIVG